MRAVSVQTGPEIIFPKIIDHARQLLHIAVYNMLGRRVAVLVNGDAQAGRHETILDASALYSGNYIARFTAIGSRVNSLRRL